jgi:hypothetical protein
MGVLQGFLGFILRGPSRRATESFSVVCTYVQRKNFPLQVGFRCKWVFVTNFFNNLCYVYKNRTSR